MSNRRSYSFSLVSALADRAFIDAVVHTEHRRRFRATALASRADAGAASASESTGGPTIGGRSS
jgi:hypothetical protein